MNSIESRKWLATLEILAVRKPDEAEAEWAWVMKELGLGPEYFLAVYEVVRQGRWREAENPGGYVKASARRERRNEAPGGGRKVVGIRGIQGLEGDAEEFTLGRDLLSDGHGEGITGEEMLDYMEHRRVSGRPVKDPDNVFRIGPQKNTGAAEDRGGRVTPGSEADINQALSRKARRSGGPGVVSGASRRLRRLAEKLERMRAAQGKDERDEPWMEEEGCQARVDWPAWADKAGLSEWEKKAVEYRTSGIGRNQALGEQPDEASRKALQAAWRSLARTGEERLRENLPADDADSR